MQYEGPLFDNKNFRSEETFVVVLLRYLHARTFVIAAFIDVHNRPFELWETEVRSKLYQLSYKSSEHSLLFVFVHSYQQFIGMW